LIYTKNTYSGSITLNNIQLLGRSVPLVPFILSLNGVLLDYLTTIIGSSFGFHEFHAAYHPLNALSIFWGAIAVLTLLLPKKRPWTTSINGIALVSYAGMINNVLVICGIFSGLRI
jgi:hypothetical protein